MSRSASLISRAVVMFRERRGDLAPTVIRLLRSPSRESRRIWTYAASRGDARTAFLDYQGRFMKSRYGHAERLAAAPLGANAVAAISSDQLDTSQDSMALGALLNKYGSDKASRHDYYKVYEALAVEIGQPRVVLEIGIGTSAPRASSMGEAGSPGASARAFRDWGSHVIACDIDRSILFQEPGIQSFYLDQLRPSTFAKALRAARSVGGIDLGVVDGLHTPEADVTSMLALAPVLTRTGIVVVEDIEPDMRILEMWRGLLSHCSHQFATALLPTRASWIALVGHSEVWSRARLEALYAQ